MTAPGGRSVLVVALACAAIVVVASGPQSAEQIVQVESWTRQRLDSRGVPWPRWPTMLRARLIGYLWDEHLPVRSIHQSQKTGTVTFIVVHSGKKELGAWLTERRNVREDYLMVYGEEPENPPVIALSIDTNDTKSSTETFISPIDFRGDTR